MRRWPFFVSALVFALAVAPAFAQPRSDTWLTEVAQAYRAWGRVDDELRWAPWLCRMPMPSRARVSRGETAHGRKVYFVYSSDRPAYLGLTRGASGRPPVGFTVVKEAFHPRELTDADRGPGNDPFHRRFVRIPGAPETSPTPEPYLDDAPNIYDPIVEDGHRLGAGAPGGLYVLRYLGRRARGTDRGWVYGTVAPDGQVTSSGVVESCVGCHRAAPHGRLFGLDG